MIIYRESICACVFFVNHLPFRNDNINDRIKKKDISRGNRIQRPTQTNHIQCAKKRNWKTAAHHSQKQGTITKNMINRAKGPIDFLFFCVRIDFLSSLYIVHSHTYTDNQMIFELMKAELLQPNVIESWWWSYSLGDVIQSWCCSTWFLSVPFRYTQWYIRHSCAFMKWKKPFLAHKRAIFA